MTEDALHALAVLLDTWGVSPEELVEEFQGAGSGDGAAGKLVRWDEFLQVVRGMPGDLAGADGGGDKLRSALGVTLDKPTIDLGLLQRYCPAGPPSRRCQAVARGCLRALAAAPLRSQSPRTREPPL